MDAVKVLDRKSMLDRAASEAELDQLTVRDHAVLPLRDPDELVLPTWATYPRYVKG